MTEKFAARRTDKTSHGGEITSGSLNVDVANLPAARLTDLHICPLHVGGAITTGSETVQINGRNAARVGDFAMCTAAVPPPLTPEQIEADAIAFLKDLGISLGADQDLREFLIDEDDLRRKFLVEAAIAEHQAGKTSGEVFINAVQRSRWIHAERWFKPGLDIGRDIGYVFAGTGRPMHGTGIGDDHTYNINVSKRVTNPEGGSGLPFTGFKEEFRNDDPGGTPADDQTHHLAFYTMWGSGIMGANDARIVGFLHDMDAPQDRALAYKGVDLGLLLWNKEADIHAWFWENLGDPSNGAVAADVITTGEATVLIGD